ncbi:hypothetical protein HPB50_012281 [Hyalomma asiaticum]|uniref:Uncharacterized protein n=1 Tax=Hyalomma asiaticum TaxID=266040 RepID=A0ACB7S8P4_HYAAI|nr:hypothetical protein HPB50_012281 [Hyalomma asiaticum]
MAEQGPVESERASPAPGDSPRSGGSVFSADGDRTLVGIPPINLGVQMQTAHVAAPSGVPAPPPAALPSGSLFPNNEPGEEVTQAAFHRAISYQKDITDLLFDPACKVTNTQRSKIIALLRSILQECADIRAVAARQAGRVDELRYQLARPSTVSTGVPGVTNPAHPVPGPSYASVLAGKHNSDQVASRMTAPSTLPPHTVPPDDSHLPTTRQEHAFLMFLTPLQPSTSPANDVFRLIKSNIDPAKEKIGSVTLHGTDEFVDCFRQGAEDVVRDELTRSTMDLDYVIKTEWAPAVQQLVGSDHATGYRVELTVSTEIRRITRRWKMP